MNIYLRLRLVTTSFLDILKGSLYWWEGVGWRFHPTAPRSYLILIPILIETFGFKINLVIVIEMLEESFLLFGTARVFIVMRNHQGLVKIWLFLLILSCYASCSSTACRIWNHAKLIVLACLFLRGPFIVPALNLIDVVCWSIAPSCPCPSRIVESWSSSARNKRSVDLLESGLALFLGGSSSRSTWKWLLFERFDSLNLLGAYLVVLPLPGPSVLVSIVKCLAVKNFRIAEISLPSQLVFSVTIASLAIASSYLSWAYSTIPAVLHRLKWLSQLGTVLLMSLTPALLRARSRWKALGYSIFWRNHFFLIAKLSERSIRRIIRLLWACSFNTWELQTWLICDLVNFLTIIKKFKIR